MSDSRQPTVTIPMRFCMHDRRKTYATAGQMEKVTAVRLASSWEAFPEWYSAEQIAAAVEMHVAIWLDDSERIDAAVAVCLGLKDDRG